MYNEKVCLLKQSKVLLLVLLVYPSRRFLYHCKLKFLGFLFNSFPFYENI